MRAVLGEPRAAISDTNRLPLAGTRASLRIDIDVVARRFRSMSALAGKCLTCYDSGELVTEFGPVVCPDCAGDPGAVSAWEQTERRLRDIEQRYAEKPDIGAEVQWLVFELRGAR